MPNRKKSPRTSSRKKTSKRERKERLVQTRITPSLYEQVVKRAEALRIPVSNLIRIVLEESDKLVGGVVDQSLNIAEAFTQGKTQASPADSKAAEMDDQTPVAWQPVIMGRRAVCGQCAEDLYPSEPAHMGLGTDGRPLLFCCPACFDRIQKTARPKPQKKP